MTKVLLIEDDFRLRTALRQLLVQENFEVIEADEGEAGIRLYEEHRPDVVVTDLIMPGKEGMETIIDLRKMDPAVRIIAISGGGRVRGEEYLMVAEAAGADRTLSKPFSFDKLLQAIHELLS